MKQLARNIFKALEQEEYAIPDYTQLEDHTVAKQVMKDYLKDLIEQVGEETSAEDTSEAVNQATEEAQEILASYLFIKQKGIRSLVDKDARVGYKSKTHSFYGYKAVICRTTDGSLRVSVNTPELYEYSQRAKTPEFLNEYRKRAKIEPKHAELKRFHGLDRAKGYGLQSVRIQAKLTALAVNLKRIAKLVSA